MLELKRRKRRRRGFMAAAAGGRNMSFPESLPGLFAFYDGESMTTDAEEDITAWANRLGDATYDLTIPDAPNQPVAEVVEAFNGRQCATFTGGQSATSSTLNTLFTGNAAFTAYFACQFQRDETAVDPLTNRVFIAANAAATRFLVIDVIRSGSGPYTYTVTVNKQTSAGSKYLSVVADGGAELSSDKIYGCLVSSTGSDASLYIDSISNADTAEYNSWSCTLDDKFFLGSNKTTFTTRPHHGPIGGIYLYDQAHSVTQIQSMIENWMPSYFGPIGDTIQALSPTYYAKASEAILDGGSWEFNGVDSVASAVDTVANEFDLSGDFSIGGWCKLDNTGSWYSWLFSQGNDFAANSINIFFYQSQHSATPDRIKVKLFDDSSNVVPISTNSPGASTEWQHILVTYDDSENDLFLYVNGVVVASATSATLVGGISGKTVMFGDAPNVANAELNGSLRNWAKWNSALSETNIASLIANASPDDVDSANLSWHIPMDSATSSDGAHTIDGLTVTNADITGSDDGARVTELTNLANMVEGWGYNGADAKSTVTNATAMNTTGDFSISMWVKLNSNSGNTSNYFFSRGAYATNGSIGMRFSGGEEASNNNDLWIYVVGDGGEAILYHAGNIGESRDWMHIAITYDASAGTGTLYINGALASSPSASGTLGAVGIAANLVLGSAYDGNSNTDCTMRHVAFYNDTALTTDQITLLAAGATPDNVGTPSWHLPMTQATSTAGPHTIDGLEVNNTNVTGELKAT